MADAVRLAGWMRRRHCASATERRGGHEVQERTGSRITSSGTLPMHEMAFALEKLGLYRSRTAVTAVKAALKVRFLWVACVKPVLALSTIYSVAKAWSAGHSFGKNMCESCSHYLYKHSKNKDKNDITKYGFEP
ncbi:MAG TPA: hypothetical protein VL220_03295 [Steroidobacteraceae bacterium]|nr:hypothetical protein [Steroidobacteraceae bacterium]